MTEELKEEINQTDPSASGNVQTEEAGPEIVSETGGETNILSETDQLKADLAEQQDKYLRLVAEFDNFKKRNAKEMREFYKTAGQDIIRDLLPVLDDYKRANNVFEQDKNADTYVQGLQLIQEKLNKALQQKGLREIESIGKDFDIQFHEAIAEVPAPSEDLKGKIVDEVESGYTLNGSIIRYAKVVVGK
jgi:molecular chaperone GrpE